MQPVIVFRSPAARGYAIACWVIAVVVLLAFASHGGAAEVLGYGALPIVLAVTGWALFWRPELQVQRDGLRVVNVLSTTWLPWHAVTGTKTRWGLELLTADGKVGVWAVPARGTLGRWAAERRSTTPAVPRLESLEGRASGGGDPVAAAELIEEQRTGFPGIANQSGERRLDVVPAGLLLASAALAAVTLLL